MYFCSHSEVPLHPNTKHPWPLPSATTFSFSGQEKRDLKFDAFLYHTNVHTMTGANVCYISEVCVTIRTM